MQVFQAHHGRLSVEGAPDATKAASPVFGILQQARALAVAGERMCLLVARSGLPEEIFDFYGVPFAERFELVQLPALRRERRPRLALGAVFDLGCLWELRRRSRPQRPAVLYLREVKLARFFLRARRWLGMPIVLEFHNFRFPDPGRAAEAYDRTEAFVLRQVDALLTTTRALAEAARRVYGLEREPIPIPLAAEHSEATGQLDTTAWPSRPITLCYLGQLYRLQGVEVAVEALARLPRCRLLILGGREADGARLRSLAEQAGCGSRLEFAGFVPPHQVAARLAQADIFLLPALAEGRMPYASHQKLYEYLAARRPVVASDLPSIREDVVDGESALLVVPGSPQALAGAVTRLLESPELARRMAEAGYSLAERFTYRARATRLIEVFRRVLQAGASE
jgi:glycosyltransferase involved in cell wall biosynthesis